MPHIHTKPGQHDLTASAFIIRLDGSEPRAMLHLHRKLNKYMQFGGHVELHEDPWEAITHELAEEAGYSLPELSLLQPPIRQKKFSDSKLHPYPLALNTHHINTYQPGDHDQHFHTDIAFAFVASAPPANQPHENESTIMRLFTVAELTKLAKAEIPENVRQTFLFALRDCLPNWEQIPADTVA